MFEDERLSYGELDARSSQLAHHLRGLGVGPEVVVGLCIERSLAMLVGLLGILKAGGAYLPLDPDYPPERLAFMLADAGAPVLLTRAALRAHLPAHDVTRSDDTHIDDAHIVCLDADWPAIAQQPTTAPAVGSPAATPCLCHLHVRLHRNARRASSISHPQCGAAGAERDYVELTPDDCFPAVGAAFSFDAAAFGDLGRVTQLEPSWSSLRMARCDMRSLKRTIADAGVSVLWLTACTVAIGWSMTDLAGDLHA